MKILTFCSFKGGTGKTSCSLHLGAALAKYHKKRVLLVDFDPQANLSTGLGFGTDHLQTMVPVLKDEAPIEAVIQETQVDRLDIICANTYLDQIETTQPLVTDPYAHERLRNVLRTQDYDFIMIDTPPSLGWLTQSAFFAAHHSLVCAVPEPYSVLALERLSKYHEAVNRHHPLTTLGVVLSLWSPRGATNIAFEQAIDVAFPDCIFETKVRRDISVNRAILRGQPVFEVYPRSRAGADFKALAKEFLKRCKHLESTETLATTGS